MLIWERVMAEIERAKLGTLWIALGLTHRGDEKTSVYDIICLLWKHIRYILQSAAFCLPI